MTRGRAGERGDDRKTKNEDCQQAGVDPGAGRAQSQSQNQREERRMRQVVPKPMAPGC